MREFRFGFNTTGLQPARELVTLCREAEGLGYDVVLGTDHLTGGSPFLPLVTAAAATERMRVGTLTINNEFWNPAMLAREAITVDHLTEGRLELGLGAGYMKWEIEAAGMPWRPIGERIDRLGQTIERLGQMFAKGVGEPESAVRIREQFGRPEFKPVQRRGFGGFGPPLLIGGSGDRVLTLAARHADIVGMGGLFQIKGEPPGTFRIATAAEADDRVAFVRKMAGSRADDVELNTLIQIVEITDDRRGFVERLVAEKLPGDAVEDLLQTPFILVGTVRQIAEQVRENRERYGFSNLTVHQPYMRAFGRVIEELRA